MAGNFWKSSHYQQWLLDKKDLLRERQADLKILTEEEYTKIIIFFANFMSTLGPMVNVKHQVIATAIIYFKRFYSRHSFKDIDPLLMAPTCVFLAAKVEEWGVVSSSRLVTSCQQLVKTKFNYAYQTEFPYRIQNILECEFYLLELMDCCLILYHPYRPLLQYASDLGTEDSDNVLPLAWRIVNDSLRTDVPLMFPPYLIALTALYMACTMQQKDAKHWFAELNVDMDKILEITCQIMALYDMWNSYDEKKQISSLLATLPKPKTNPSRPPSQGPNGQEVPNQAQGQNQGQNSQGQMSSQSQQQ